MYLIGKNASNEPGPVDLEVHVMCTRQTVIFMRQGCWESDSRTIPMTHNEFLSIADQYRNAGIFGTPESIRYVRRWLIFKPQQQRVLIYGKFLRLTYT